MPSFDAINYSLRPNKNVERKLVFGALRQVDKKLSLQGHRYIGLGSVWFVDFVYAHRWLNISNMISIEADDIGASRARFNRPLGCISVEHGDTSTILPQLDQDAPALIWLDYDSGITGPALQDIQTTLPRLRPGSIFLVTLSAKPDDLRRQDGEDEALVDLFKAAAGDFCPANISSRRLRRKDYSALVAETIKNCFTSTHVQSGREEQWIELIDLAYSDSTPMITVGGLITPPTLAEGLKEIVNGAGWPGMQQSPISLHL